MRLLPHTLRALQPPTPALARGIIAAAMAEAGADTGLRDAARREAVARVRISAPLGCLVLFVGLTTSEAVGVPLAGWVVGWNVFSVALLAFFAWAARGEKLPLAAAHAVAAIAWLLLPLSSIASLIATGSDALVLPIIAMVIAAPWVQLSRLGLLLSTSASAVLWLVLSEGSALELFDSFPNAATVASVILSNVAGHIGWRRFVERYGLRNQLEETNAALRRELEERRRSQSEAEAYRDQFIAAQRSEAIGTLASGLAHEMNNVLAGILGASEMLGEDAEDAAAVKRTATVIAREAKRGGALTKSLLAFARRGQYQRSPAELDGIVEDVRKLLLGTLRRDIELTCDPASDTVVDVDRAQLIQAVLNLALNGVDAMPDGGELVLRASVEEIGDGRAEALDIPPGRYAVVRVRDTGTGMDVDTKLRASEPFFTTKPPGKGTGLGLAMVDGSARAHGGSIEIESNVGKGTTVSVILPIHDEDASAPSRPTPDPESVDRKGAVLVVDDEPLIRSALGRMLARAGFEVMSAPDGAVAVEKFEADDAIGLVICDMNMPVMSGPDCIRAMSKIRRVPVLIVSGYAVQTDAQELIAEGLAAGFVEKPFTQSAIISAVDAALAAAPRVRDSA